MDSVSEHIRTLVACMDDEVDRETLQSILGIKHRTYFRNKYLKPSINEGYIEFTLPNEKQSKLQKYRLTAKGLALKETLKYNE
ncbi:Fic family protein [Phocaeicola coprocola]|uniref:Fic family protein n=1 Tax=Phocaeicola coprocola TaxID=310298 RepID=UPI0032C157F7